jgi:Resolvase, N terminal domain
MRIGLYARVSTQDKGQDPKNQLRQLRQWCESAGHELVHEYVDHESGRKGTTAASSSPCCSRTLTSASLTVCCSGPSTASPAKVWRRPSCTCSA